MKLNSGSISEMKLNYCNENMKIEKCIDHCPFYGSDMDGMYCGHPFWNGADPYVNHIISSIDNSPNGDTPIPKLCPLRVEPLQITFELTPKS